MANRLQSYNPSAIYTAQSQSQIYQQGSGQVIHTQPIQTQPIQQQFSAEQIAFFQRQQQTQSVAASRSVIQAKQTIESLLLSLIVQKRPDDESYDETPVLMFNQQTLQELYFRFQQEGLPFLSLERRDEVHSFIQIYSEYGVDFALNCLKHGTLDWEIILMPGAFKKYILDMDLSRNKSAAVEGAFICPKCSGKNTEAVAMQMRSGDEGTDAKVTCKDCGMKWIIRG